jgi:hypothetical protein
MFHLGKRDEMEKLSFSVTTPMDNMYYLKYLVQEDLVDGHCPNLELHI